MRYNIYMFTIIKLDTQRTEKVRYQGEILSQTSACIVIQADWTNPTLDLGYTRFEQGDHFTEYYYVHCWFNIFSIASADGTHKGWYCNIVEPPLLFAQHIEQVDLYLDVWINSTGQYRILDEDEFRGATLSKQQRQGALQGLQALLHLLASQQGPFSQLA